MANREIWRNRWELVGLAWLIFYLTMHFNVNDEKYSFWLPMKFVVALPQALFSMAVVYGFNWVGHRPLDVPISRLVLYLLMAFVLQHVVYYYALATAQPFAPIDSVTYRRWSGFMAQQGPFYFLQNPHYLLTVSPYIFFSQVCLPLAIKFLSDVWREQQRLGVVRRHQLSWELTALRTRLNPAFLQQTLGYLVQLLVRRESAAAEFTLKFAHVLRYSLYTSTSTPVPLQSELDAYLDYVQLHEMRWGEQVEVTSRFTAEPEGPRRILSGVLLPLTAQWLSLTSTASMLDLELRVSGSYLTLSIIAEGKELLPAANLVSLTTQLLQAVPGTHQLKYNLSSGRANLYLRLTLLV